MSKLPLVTIMIPTYNQAAFLPRAIASALSQQYENIEVVICDDHSTDNTMEVLNQYRNDYRIKIFQNQRNIGRVPNYKHILEDLAAGEWVVNLDGDDFFTDPEFISRCIHLITSSAADIVFCQAGHVTKMANGKLISVSLPNTESEIAIIDGKDYFLNFHHFSHLGSLYNRQKAVSVGFYKLNILSTDIESFLRLALHGKVILIKQPVGVWVHHGANESKNLTLQNVDRNMLRFESPYKYAKSLHIFNQKELDRWRLKKQYGYLLSYLTLYFTNPAAIPNYLQHIRKIYPIRMTMMLVPYAYIRALKQRWKRNNNHL